jgi:hypothetical protein
MQNLNIDNACQTQLRNVFETSDSKSSKRRKSRNAVKTSNNSRIGRKKTISTKKSNNNGNSGQLLNNETKSKSRTSLFGMLSPKRNSRNNDNNNNNNLGEVGEINNKKQNTSRHISIKPDRSPGGVYNRNYSSDSDIIDMRPSSADERLKLETVVEIGN